MSPLNDGWSVMPVPKHDWFLKCSQNLNLFPLNESSVARLTYQCSQ